MWDCSVCRPDAKCTAVKARKARMVEPAAEPHRLIHSGRRNVGKMPCPANAGRVASATIAASLHCLQPGKAEEPPMRYLAWIAALLLLAAAPALAQTYPAPNRTIRLISPNPPGGANDTISRIMSARMAAILGTRIIIDNRGGAGGVIGGELAARAAPDGYTLLTGSVSTHSFAPIMTPDLSYDPIKDFSPISMMAVVQNVLVVNAELQVNSVQDLVALAKKNPGTLK